MGTGYTRQDTSNNIANGNVIDADDLDAEFNAVESAFSSDSGHTHDGTSGEGAPIEVIGPNQEYLSDVTAFYPKTDNSYDLGKVGAEWKDFYISGVATLGSIVTEEATVNGPLSADSLTIPEATVNGPLSANSLVTPEATVNGPLSADSLTASTADIDGGTLDSVVIGSTTAGAGTFTTLTATNSLAGTLSTSAQPNVTSLGTLISLSVNGNATVGGDISATNISVSGTVDGRNISSDGSKLDGIEAGATADQTASEIKTLYESNANTNAFTNTEKSKLSGIEENADVTDTANVTAAGALMDSEVENLNAVKNFDPNDYATATQGGKADTAVQPSDIAWSPASANTTASSGEKVAADVSSGPWTLTLPSSPAAYETVTLTVIDGDPEVNNLTVDGNNNTILGDSTLIVDTKISPLQLVFIYNGNEWRII